MQDFTVKFINPPKSNIEIHVIPVGHMVYLKIASAAPFVCVCVFHIAARLAHIFSMATSIFSMATQILAANKPYFPLGT